ncbi:hypothetical protein [Thiomonas delicata]|uniref:Uncharacterized protein n=1 Tax=Thiomonas delicata TaxID=364030 RepID=A0A238D9A2_THIDL|nr:hypothetical protein [Thiomonas delicata]SBP89714.1 conserved membrane hypothetical protein [Thiomonas delicata]
MQTPLDADAASLPHAGLAAGLRDLTLALFWSDAAAGVRGCRRLAQRATRAGLPPQQARLRATHRLLAGMVIVTLGTPPLVIALAAAGHVLVGSSAEGRHLLLALSLASGLLYGRGVLQLGRPDAWWRALYRNAGMAVQALPLRRVLASWRPAVLDASIGHPWTQARRWAWAAGVNLLTWVGILAWLPADSPRLVSFWLAGLGVLSMTWLLKQHHRCMLRALAAFIAAGDAVWC